MTALRRAASLGALALAAWLSLTPTPPAPQGGPERADLVAHAGIHLGVAATAALAWAPPLAAALAASAALGLEAGQLAVPNRRFDWLDLGANLLGAAAGLGLVRLGRRRIRRRGTG
jgi:hypothetical protein